MRILLVGNYVPDGQRSMLAYADALAEGLAEQGVEVRRIAPTPRLLGGRSSSGGFGKWLGYLDKFVLFPPVLRRSARDVDIVHLCDQGNGLLVPHLRRFRSLLTCHDVIAIRAARGEMPGMSVGRSGRLFQRLNLRGLETAKEVVCVSETTRRQLEAVAPRPPEHTYLVRNGLYERFPALTDSEAAAVLARQGIEPNRRFILHLGMDTPYKNRAGAIRIFAALKRLPGGEDLILVLAGPPHSAETQRVVDESGVTDWIRVLVDVDRETKTALYRRALALLFPSLVEGFGLPIVEAQTLGCPVITSNRPPMNEIAGGAALLIDPDDEAGAARTIAESLGQLPELAERGAKNAEDYTFLQMIDGYVELYKSLLARTR